MKSLILLCAFLCIALIQATELSAEQKAEILKIHKECRLVSGLTDADEDHIIHHQYDQLDKVKVKKHFLCVAKKTGYMKEDGTWDTALMRQRSTEQKTSPAEIERIITECAVQKDTPERTAIHFFKCKHDIVGEVHLRD